MCTTNPGEIKLSEKILITITAATTKNKEKKSRINFNNK
jgi:hypothetical protein